MKEVDIFGMKIKDYTLKESLKLTRTFLHEPGLHTISYISRNLLMSVADFPYQKEWLKNLDLILFAEPIETDNKTRLSNYNCDGKSDDYLNTVLRNIYTSGEAIYLVSDTRENLENFKRLLLELNSRLSFAGECVLNETDSETMFNEINYIFPKQVFSCLPWAKQGPLMMEAKRMLSIPVWFGFLPQFIENDKSGSNFGKVKWLDQLKFYMKLKKYNKLAKEK